MAIKTSVPACRVDILNHKPVLDLTPYLGEGGSVQVVKDLYAPKGRFQITLPEQPWRQDGKIKDSFFGLIAPMDIVNIRMARNRHEYQTTDNMPIVMRGFVRDITRSESIGADGQPTRHVRITGDDYGMFAEIARIHPLAISLVYGMPADAALFPALENLQDAMMPAGEAVKWVLENLVNAQLEKMSGYKDRPSLLRIDLKSTVTKGYVHLFKLVSEEGTAWQKMQEMADAPWNELFLDEDPENGATLIFRPTPWCDLDGNPIDNMGQPSPIEVIEDSFDFVQSATYQRSDEHVYNIIWGVCHSSAVSNARALADALAKKEENVLITDLDNSAAALYGHRIMTQNSYLYPSEDPPYGNDKEKQAAVEVDYVGWSRQRRRWLIDANKDNVMFCNGSLVVRGNERLRPGRYYDLTRGGLKIRHYLTQVEHEYRPFHGFTSHLTFIRSDNIHQRAKKAADSASPYLLEGYKGVY